MLPTDPPPFAANQDGHIRRLPRAHRERPRDFRQPRDVDRDPPRLVKGQLPSLDGFAFGGTRIEIGERLTCRIANHVAAREFLFAPRRGEASSHCCPLHAVPSTALPPPMCAAS